MTIRTAACLALALLAGGCRKQEKVCEHLKAFVDDGKYSDDECRRDLYKVRQQCKNSDVVFQCFLGKVKEEDLADCEAVCEKK